jgi:hypothetical protein
MAPKQTSLRGFLKTMTEEDTRHEFEKLTQNLEREAAKKAACEAFETLSPLIPKRPVGRPRKVQPQMSLLSASTPLVATTGIFY